MPRPLLVSLLIALALPAAPTASAAPKRPKGVAGVVVRVAGDELIVDLGAEAGVPEGATLQIYRRLEVTHPVTGKAIVDRFPIGRVTLAELGQRLSIVRAFDHLARAAKAGDFVVFEAPAPARGPSPARPTAKAPNGAEGPSPPPAAPAADPALEAVLATFQSSLGHPLGRRLELWRAFLATHGDSVYAPIVQREVALLEGLTRLAEERAEQARREAQVPAEPARPVLTTHVAAPRAVFSDEPLVIYAAVLQPDEVTELRLLARRGTTGGFETLPMQREGTHGWQRALTGVWLAPGPVAWRVEAVRPDGELEQLGRGLVEVAEPGRDAVDVAGRSRASARFDWVSFWADESSDQFMRFEADFRYRLDAGFLEAFRIGVGVLQGRGGSTDGLELGTERARSRALSYGVAELEMSFHAWFGMSALLIAGNNLPDDDRPLEGVFGGGFELRVGKLDATRLLGGATFTQEVGNEFWLRLLVEEFAHWPMRAAIVVTNLPVMADYGVSLGYTAGWRPIDLFELQLTVGWNARTINHFGFTAGAGVALAW